MANEFSVRTSLQLKIGNQNYQSQPTSFQATQVGLGGPTPGQITALTTGTDVDLSQLVTPGLCRLMNLDPTNYVEYGIRDPGTGSFYPLGEIQPGETYVLRFSRNLLEAFVGTGTTGDVNKFTIRASVASCKVLVEAFEA